MTTPEALLTALAEEVGYSPSELRSIGGDIAVDGWYTVEFILRALARALEAAADATPEAQS